VTIDGRSRHSIVVSTRIVVESVELTVTQTTTELGTYVKVKRLVGRDRKRKLNLTGGIETQLERGNEAISLLITLKQVAALKTVKCACDYRYGYSDHAEHCQSIHVAKDYDRGADDD
jgi:hypothetical protein